MYQKSETLAPFWAKSKDYNPGRDHLGIQNASVAVYAELLPGLTNVTQRLRYYGFYCWALHTFRGEEQLTNLIRRSELFLAFIMKGNPELASENAVSGSNYAVNILAKGEEVVDLAKGADKENEGRYWAYSTGAFGQYFFGSLQNLQLVHQGKEERTYVISNKAIRLAECFDKNIPSAVKDLFLKIVKEGNFVATELLELTAFSLSADFTNTDEGQFYRDMFAGADYGETEFTHLPTRFLRKQSFKSILNYISEGGKVNDFPVEMYFKKGKGNTNDDLGAEFGWYYFQLNEYLHFALETVFWSVLYFLDGQSRPVNQFADNFWEELNNVEESPSEELDDEKSYADDEIGLTETIFDCVKATRPFDAFVAAYSLIDLLYENNKELIEKSDRFAFQYDVKREGAATDFFREFCIPNLGVDNKIVVKKIVKFVITQHLNTAYGKMGTSEKNVLKLVIEDGYLTCINLVTPSFTSPRLGSLRNFLRDFRMIHPETGAITQIGKDYLKNLSK